MQEECDNFSRQERWTMALFLQRAAHAQVRT
jgi:hypothetical protein